MKCTNCGAHAKYLNNRGNMQLCRSCVDLYDRIMRQDNNDI